jgi:hypothetical protein
MGLRGNLSKLPRILVEPRSVTSIVLVSNANLHNKVDLTPLTRRDFEIFREVVKDDVQEVVKQAVQQGFDRMRQSRTRRDDEDEEAGGSLADTESECESPAVRRKPKLPTKHRTAGRPYLQVWISFQTNPLLVVDLPFQALIREHGRLLMGRESPDSFFNRVAASADVAEYDATKGEIYGINLNHLGNLSELGTFRVDIAGYPKSAWNKSCARVFARSFVNKYPEYAGKNGRTSSVQAAWITHFDYLRKTYQQQQKSARQKAEVAGVHRRRERKNQVSFPSI